MKIEITINKSLNDCLYVSSKNNILFTPKNSNTMGAQQYIASYARDCGPSSILVVTLEYQVKTIVSLIYLCRQNDLRLHMSTTTEHSITDCISNDDLELRLAMTGGEMKKLFSEIEKELSALLKNEGSVNPNSTGV